MSYPTKEQLHAQVEHNHSYHRPDYQDTMDAMAALRQTFKNASHLAIEVCPLGRELSVALTHLEDASMWAIAALARNEPIGTRPNVTSHPTGGFTQPDPPLLPGDPGYVEPQTNIGRTFDSGQTT